MRKLQRYKTAPHVQGQNFSYFGVSSSETEYGDKVAEKREDKACGDYSVIINKVRIHSALKSFALFTFLFAARHTAVEILGFPAVVDKLGALF